MRKYALFPFVLLLFICMCDESRGQTGVSPKLWEFLTEHPAASQVLSNVISQVFTNRTFQLYYFYSDDESVPRASHDYISKSEVAIYIRENQQPFDEFIGLLFEALNSTSENKFLELFAQAKSATIPKSEFASAGCKLEFDAVRRARDLLINIKLRKSERNKSHFYKLFMGAPNNFLVYSKNVSSRHQDIVKEWGMKYDSLQNEWRTKYDFWQKEK
jgi:hypothetical protein